MKTAPLITLLGIGLILPTTGCELSDCADEPTEEEAAAEEDKVREKEEGGNCFVLKSLKRFNETPARAETVEYSPGERVLIDSRNGDIVVKEGVDAVSVSVTFNVFVFRAFDTPDETARRNFDQIDTTVTQTADGIEVETARVSGAPSTLGADITVELPTGFDGALAVQQDNGQIQIDYTGVSNDVRVVSGNGSIDAVINEASNVLIDTDNGSIDALLGVGDNVEITSGNGSLVVDIASVPDGAAGGPFFTDLGDIDLILPEAGAFSLQAVADDLVDFSPLPSACTEEEAAPNSKTLSCNGGGAEFTASALGIGGEVLVSYR